MRFSCFHYCLSFRNRGSPDRVVQLICAVLQRIELGFLVVCDVGEQRVGGVCTKGHVKSSLEFITRVQYTGVAKQQGIFESFQH